MKVQCKLLLARAKDPLLTFVPLPYEREFYPYGFPLRITSNSLHVLAAAEESWGGLRQRFGTAPLKLRCLVSESAVGVPAAASGGACAAQPVCFRGRSRELLQLATWPRALPPPG